MKVNDTALDKFMDAFGLKLFFLPDEPKVGEKGVLYCNKMFIMKGEEIHKQTYICHVEDTWDGELIFKEDPAFIENGLRDTLLAYLGTDGVTKELIKRSREYTENLLRMNYFD